MEHTSLLDNEAFQRDYEALKHVQLHPGRHTAENAWQHCEQVRARSASLATQNALSKDAHHKLDMLSLLHDIGKIEGTARPEKSVELMERYGVEQLDWLKSLVKYHDTNLPWYISAQKQQAPSDKAWRKLLKHVDIDLLCLFMIADRVDCPGGWKENKALMWFVHEVEKRKLLSQPLYIDEDTISL
ncbi:MAG TPA: hypothetical protein DCE42_00950 [Myxococcales bacterium]|nr:hypothetical protein [Deltaproteobacteria bacterium]MBU54247.1 hypothetical protein [Deltaproteobacteria bacterium]HAA53288.1 hypothetical protein [Myxococcales bacterium]|tara:strand:- start:8537 stop:9094 length:558 start_codon:yes stop_codon:yes gene_type:complete